MSKKKRYEVTIQEVETREAMIEVEARSEDEAEEVAMKQVRAEDFEWQGTDTTVEGVCELEEEDEEE